MLNTEEYFPLDSQHIYFSNDPLTLMGEDDKPITLKMGSWLNFDPVRIHKMIVREKILQVDQVEVMAPLVSKLRRADPEYFKKLMGLQLVIDFPGYGSGILAKIPFENDPVGFYKWWRKGKHEDKVHLSKANMIVLFQKVSMMDKKMILKKDLELIR